MAGTDGPTTNPLTERLAADPFAFDFFQAVRGLECLHARLPRIGYSLSPSEDPVRFAQNPSLAFAPSTLEAFRQTGADAAPRLFVRCFGLFGPHGPLPLHLTEYAYERQLHYGDRTLAAFFNIFHHRLVSFFYRAWADNHKTVDLDRSEAQRFATFIGSFCGLGQEALQQRDAVPDAAKLYFCGRLACQTRNAEGLAAILGAYFEIKTQVQTFVGRWMNLPSDSIWRLGESPETGRLGVNTIVGSRTWNCQLNFRVRLGPMPLADYERMLPWGGSFARLKYWVLNYCGEHFRWDAVLVLRADQVPNTSLGRFGRLGWTTWLKTGPFDHDAEDLILQPPSN